MRKNTMNNCWICGNIANSKEHKFKASDIKRIHGKKFDAYYVKGKATEITSYKDRILKFIEVICDDCNVKRTRPHDDTYDKFIDYCLANYEVLVKQKEIRFDIIYGNNWVQEKMNLWKYIAKHAGCKIVTCDTFNQYPQCLESLSNFILGQTNESTIALKFEIKQIIKLVADTKMREEKSKYGHLFNMSIFPFGDTSNLNFGGWISNHWLTINWVHSNNIIESKLTNFKQKNENLTVINLDFYDVARFDKFDEFITHCDIGQLDTNEKQLEHYQNIIARKH